MTASTDIEARDEGNSDLNLHVGDSFPLLGCDSTNMAQSDAVGVEPSTQSDECELVSLPYPTSGSGSEKAAPIGGSVGAGPPVGVAILEMALRCKVVVDRGKH